MDTLESLLDRLGERTGLADRQIGLQLLKVSHGAVTSWRTRRAFPDDDQAIALADALQLPHEYVLAIVRRERSKSKAARDAWQRIVDTFGRAAALAFFVLAPFSLPHDARANFTFAGIVFAVPVGRRATRPEYTLYALLRWLLGGRP